MYSTLLFLDRPRHLRYDIQAVLDLDQLLLGGFDSVFTMEADIEALRLIYWAGLKHEDPTLSISGEGGTGDILFNAIHGGIWTFDNLMKEFTKTILADEWISPPKERKEDTGEKFTIQDYIAKMEAMNYEYLNLKPKDFYGITPREFNLMMDTAMELDNKRFGILCATVANCSGAKKKDGTAFSIDDFFYTKDRVVKQSPGTIKNILTASFGAGGE